MICKNCGAQNPDNAFICISCGAKLEPEKQQHETQNQGYNYGYGQSNNFQQSENFTQQYNNQNSGQGFNGQQNGAYTYNYNQSYNYTPVDTNLVKKGSIIAAIIVGVICNNIATIILAVIALVRCSDFENAVRTGNFQLADQKRDSIGKLRKWAWIALAIGIALSFIGVLVSLIGGIGFGLFSFLPEMFEAFSEEGFYEFGEMMIRLLK